jgi:ankyrin repeat protein
VSKKRWDEMLRRRNEVNREFIENAKMNKVENCLDLINPEMGELKADVNACFTTDNEWTALHFACWNGNFKFVNLLIYNESNIDAEAKSSVTPTMVACRRGNLKIVSIMLNAGADINIIDGKGNTCLHHAATTGKATCVDL